MGLFSRIFGNPEKHRSEEMPGELEKKMGRGFASMLFADCSPSKLPSQFISIPQSGIYAIFNEIVAMRSILVVCLTYAYFGDAKGKADKVLDSFFASIPYFMQRTGNYSEEQLRQFGRNQKIPHDRYRALLREQLADVNPKDVAKIFAEDCGMADNQSILDAAEAVYFETTQLVHEAYRIYYVPK